MGTGERHIGHATARSAPVADPRGGRLFAMPRFLVGISHRVYRHRVFAIAGAITALFLILLAVLPALFASDPKLSNTVPVYGEVSEEVVDELVHTSCFPLLVAAVTFSIWGVLTYLRCLDYVLRRRLVAIATICTLWMIEVIFKYKSFTPHYATLLWYLYYVPMTLIPLLYQLCGMRLAGVGQHRAGRRYRTALWIAAALLVAFVLTNDLHRQVFHFDRASETWSNDYTYGWGYFVYLVWTAFNFVAFFALVGRSSSYRIQRFSGTAALVLLGGAFFAVSYAMRVPWAWKLNFSLVYCVLCVVTLEICLDCGVIPSYHDIAGIFDTPAARPQGSDARLAGGVCHAHVGIDAAGRARGASRAGARARPRLYRGVCPRCDVSSLSAAGRVGSPCPGRLGAQRAQSRTGASSHGAAAPKRTAHGRLRP